MREQRNCPRCGSGNTYSETDDQYPGFWDLQCLVPSCGRQTEGYGELVRPDDWPTYIAWRPDLTKEAAR